MRPAGTAGPEVIETEPSIRIRALTPMNRLVVFSFAALCAAAAGPAAAEPTPEHAAACVAALEREAEGMAQQFRQGKVEIEPELVHRVQQGFAFIGSAYKQGVRDEEATRMLKAAEKAQESLSAAELAARQAECRAEGTHLLDHANVLERAFVQHAARRRVDKLKHAGTAVAG